MQNVVVNFVHRTKFYNILLSTIQQDFALKLRPHNYVCFRDEFMGESNKLLPRASNVVETCRSKVSNI